jgi:hypothetical protein
MHSIEHSLVWLVSIAALVALAVLVRGYFSAEARKRRRREKSNRPLVSSKRGPTIRLAVKASKPERNPKG